MENEFIYTGAGKFPKNKLLKEEQIDIGYIVRFIGNGLVSMITHKRGNTFSFSFFKEGEEESPPYQTTNYLRADWFVPLEVHSQPINEKTRK